MPSHTTLGWMVPGETPSCFHTLHSGGQSLVRYHHIITLYTQRDSLSLQEHRCPPYLPEEDAAVPAEVQGVSVLLLGGVVLLKRKVHQLPLHMTFF